ncbi:SnoaL-domain-containing protein [Xylaria castorea]|nr:SnoaL-domain-containing protein [Xylaria castorea]
MASIETILRSYVQCVNEERWQDLTKIATFPLNVNGKELSDPEAFADIIRTAGRLRITIDAITLGEETQRLGATVLAKLQLRDDSNRTIQFVEQWILWVANGKISKLGTIPDHDEMERQLSDPSYVSSPDLISTYDPGHEDTKLSTRELEDTYRAYIGCINARTTAADLPKFCHPHVIHNANRLSLGEYRLLMEDAIAAIPDLFYGINTLIVDENVQRLAVRLEFTGTPTGRFAGAEPNGRSVRFYEYVTYYFRDGKIDRVWSIVDFKSYRRQLSQK